MTEVWRQKEDDQRTVDRLRTEYTVHKLEEFLQKH
jgi:hypothetical protein